MLHVDTYDETDNLTDSNVPFDHLGDGLDQAEIEAAFKKHGRYLGGGGAQPQFTLRPAMAGLIEDALNAACKSIQDATGRTDGGIAAQVFSGAIDDPEEPRYHFWCAMREYIQAEITYQDTL